MDNRTPAGHAFFASPLCVLRDSVQRAHHAACVQVSCRRIWRLHAVGESSSRWSRSAWPAGEESLTAVELFRRSAHRDSGRADQILQARMPLGSQPTPLVTVVAPPGTSASMVVESWMTVSRDSLSLALLVLFSFFIGDSWKVDTKTRSPFRIPWRWTESRRNCAVQS